jgi:hypothetical protein
LYTLTLCYRSLQEGFALKEVHNPDYTWKSPWPTSLGAWGLVAHRAAISETHTDGEGLATHVRVIIGRKLWFVALEEKMPGENGWQIDVPWQVVDLKPQDDL